MSSKALGIIGGVAAIALAIPTDGASLTIAQGLEMAGGAMSIVGAATNNTTLTTMGGVAALGGGAWGALSGGVGGGSIYDAFNSATSPSESIDATLNPLTNANTATSIPGGEASMAPEAQGPVPSTANPVGAVQNPGATGTAVATSPEAQPLGTVNPVGNIQNPGATDTLASTTPGATGTTATPSALASPGIQGPNGTGYDPATAIPGESAALPAGAAGAPPASGGLLANAMGNDPYGLKTAALINTGASALGGAMSYMHPNPMQQAQISQQNAQTALLQQQLSQRAALNASILGLPASQWNTNGVTPGSAGVAPPAGPAGTAGAAGVGMLGTAMGGTNSSAVSAI